MQLPSSEQMTFFEVAASQYQKDLSGDTYAQGYLKGRGIGPEIAGTFRLGVVRNPLLSHERFGGRLCIPYITPSGVVTFAFRCLENHVCKETIVGRRKDGSPRYCPKYTAPDGMERTLYNVLDFKKDSQAVYVCEGELDTLTLSACGFPAIGLPGVSQWKPYFTLPFRDYTQILCVADGDDAGYKLGRFLSGELKARILRPPVGQDVNSIYSQGGVHAVQQWLAGATGP